MLKIYDVKCKSCGVEEEIFTYGDLPQCSSCGKETERMYSKMTFKLIYDNKKDVCAWGDNNYETSQYWSRIKEARNRGEDVKAPGE